MRLLTTAVVTSTISLTCVYASASRLDESPAALATVQAKVDQAQPKDRCFLYAELVSQLVDLAGKFASTDSRQVT